jgi:LAS superfamily LD-carboxypeptidase LdcB
MAKLNYPTKRLVVPEALSRIPGGKLPRRLMGKCKAGGWLYRPAAKSFNEMFVHAKSCGITLRSVGSYRSYKSQHDLFMSRYSRKDTGRVPQVTRKFDGRIWYLKKGMSPAATPGSSNHGYGLAIDIDVTNPKVYAWLDMHAPTYGFYLQGKPTLPNGKKNPEFEAWHWQKVDA